MREFHSHSLNDLTSIAEELIAQFPHGGTFLLKGTMGAGKTTFVSAVCALLGAHETSSPTFSLVNEYHSNEGKTIFHFDLYRVKNLEEALDAGIEEYLDTDSWLFIEWPDVIKPLLKGDETDIEIEDLAGLRTIRF